MAIAPGKKSRIMHEPGEMKMEKPKPSLSIPDFKGHKQIKGLDVGDKVTVYIKGKVTSKSEDEFGNHMRIEIAEFSDEA